MEILKNKSNKFDAIVIGSGMTGGIAAKELTEKGLKVLVVERGREVKHVEDYDTAMKAPWELPHRDKLTLRSAEERWANNRFNNMAKDDLEPFMTNDKENPYLEKRPFDWIRAYHTGGKSMHWGRQSYRWNENDFEANAKEGVGIDWPIRYADLAPWYTYVEKFVGISGQKENWDVLPDSHFLPPMPMNAPERFFKEKMMEKMGRKVTIGRIANLTKPETQHLSLGRSSCQYRNKCARGCPFGGYYSSLAGALPAAAKTGNMTIIHDSIVKEVIFDDTKLLSKRSLPASSSSSSPSPFSYMVSVAPFRCGFLAPAAVASSKFVICAHAGHTCALSVPVVAMASAWLHAFFASGNDSIRAPAV